MESIRKSGLLFYISSLPSKFGIGDVGDPEKGFVDIMKNTNQKLFQILPIDLTEPFFNNSPYHSVFAFAINPLFLSLERLVDLGLIKFFEFIAI